MRHGVVLGFAGAVGVWSMGCGLTADFSGLQGGKPLLPEAGLPEAGPQPGDDAGAPDSGDSGRRFCASLPAPVRLCTDFDEGNPVGAGWEATDVYGGSFIGVDTVAFSLPGSFLSAVNPSGAPASARLLQSLPTQSTHAHVEFEMLLTPGDGTFELGAVHEVTASGDTYGLFYREAGRKLEVLLRSLAADGHTQFEQTWPIGDPPPSWTRVTLDMDIGDAGSFSVQHDGTSVVNQTNVPTSTPSRAALFVELGLYTFTPGTGQARFDNAVVDWP